MKQIKSLNIRSVIRVSVVLGAVAGVLTGTLVLIVDLFHGDTLDGVLAFFVAPVVYSVMGALVNALMAKVYNLVAARLGGIELELE